MGNLRVVEDLRVLRGCQLVIEAIVENLEAKRALFRQLEEVVGDEAILASNTSSLSVTAIASACRDPGRVAGLHFFNPVPLMRLVEVIGVSPPAPASPSDCAPWWRPSATRRCVPRTARLHRQPCRTGLRHRGAAYPRRGRGAGGGDRRSPARGAGFRMGPFELFDLVGLDVSLPVMESIYRQYYEEPRYRPHPCCARCSPPAAWGARAARASTATTALGRCPSPPRQFAPGAALPPVWLGVDDEHDRAPLLTLLQRLGARWRAASVASGAALCLLAPLGADVSAAARRFAVDPTRSLAIDVLSDLERHRCLMACPATRAELQQAARTLFARDGARRHADPRQCRVHRQRTLASIVNLACDIAQQGIASVEHIDLAVRLGLGYPLGPLEWERPTGRRARAAHPRTPACTQRRPALSPQPLAAPARPTGPFLRQPDSPLAS